MGDLTLDDIARQAGVSRSTVSRVFNDQPNVRKSVRARVQAVLQQTGYHPNAAARLLASQHPRTVGLIIPRSVSTFFSDPYFPCLLQGITQACSQSQTTLTLFLVATRQDEDQLLPRLLGKHLVDGILLQSGAIGEALIDSLAAARIPLVMVGRPFHPGKLSYVDIDNVSGAWCAVRHLIRLGRRRIAIIAGPNNTTVGLDRQEGYLRALTERRYGVDPALIAESDFTEAGGYAAMRRLLEALHSARRPDATRPDAVFAASDRIAVGALRAIREAGLSVPADVAVIGFDDLPEPSPLFPSLTTVRQHVPALGFQAVEMLIDQIEHGIEPPRRVILDTELIIRESCGASLSLHPLSGLTADLVSSAPL